MIVNYRGFEINVRRDESVIGNEMFYWGVFRLSDQREMHSGCDYVETFGTSEKKATVRSEVKAWKKAVDDFLLLPEKEQRVGNFGRE